MKTSACCYTGLLLAAFLSAGVAQAQDKGKAPAAKAEKGAAKVTVVLENDKVRVFETLLKPGEENKAVPSANFRVLRALNGGTILRTYADGKTEKVEYKTGEVRYIQPSKETYTAKNVGQSDVHLYVVLIK